MNVFILSVVLILFLIGDIYFLKRYYTRHYTKSKPGDIIMDTVEGGVPYGKMAFPKDFDQLKDFLKRFFMPIGFMNTVGSVFYYLLFVICPALFIYLIATSMVIDINSLLLLVVILAIPVIIMISSGIIGVTSRNLINKD